ncbi:S-layer homology domain-containing protein [Paenibacillus yanchengensis]|uniref:S-layer homology domain-containing protein n=1 Tax=Paenibacillus yanchengensis TaxID=2035833 RepID=A0ABW4YFG6_9BACL
MFKRVTSLTTAFLLALTLFPFGYQTGNNANSIIHAAQSIIGEEASEVAETNKFDYALYLPFDTDMKDYSSNPLQVEAKGQPYLETGKVGKGAHLSSKWTWVNGRWDETNYQDYLKLGNPEKLQFGVETDFTIAFWIKSDPVSGDPVIISNKDWSDGNNTGYAIALVGSNLKWNYNTEYGEGTEHQISNVADGNWHHIAISHDRKNGIVDFYKDGSNVSNTSIEVDKGSIDTELSINIGSDGTGDYNQVNTFLLDEFKILKQTVTTEQVATELAAINLLDSKLKDIQIDGKSIENFDPLKYEYEFEYDVESRLDVPQITFEKVNETANVDVIGAEQITVGNNVVKIIVEASGSKTIYTINIRQYASSDYALYLPFDMDMQDYSPNKLEVGTVGNPWVEKGKIGNSVVLDSHWKWLDWQWPDWSYHHYLKLGKPENLQFGDNTDFTIAFWIKSDPVEGDPVIVSNKDWGNGDNRGYAVALVGSSLKWNYKTEYGARADYQITEVADGNWHHIAIVHNRSEGYAHLYKDGEHIEKVSLEGSSGTIDSGLDTNIGSDGTGDYNQVNRFMLDNFKIMRKAISLEDLKRDYEKESAITNADSFQAKLSLIGAKHAVEGTDLRYQLDLRSLYTEQYIDKIDVEISYDPASFEFIEASNAENLKNNKETGTLSLELKGHSTYNNQNELEFAQSTISELKFTVIAEAGTSDITVNNAKFYANSHEIAGELLTKDIQVTIHPKAKSDRNKDGHITISDIVAGKVQGWTTDELKNIAAELTYKPYKRVVVIGIDGVGVSVHQNAPYWDWSGAQKEAVGKRLNIPNIRGIIESGAASYTAQATVPTSSSPNWGSMLNGVGYEKHRIDNDMTTIYRYKEDWAYPSILKKLRDELPSSKLAVFATWKNIIYGHYEPSVGVENYSGIDSDDKTIELFEEYVKAGKAYDSSLMFFQLDAMDGVGHSKGFYTKEYYEELTNMDKQVGKIYDTLKVNELLEDTLIVLVTDHGGGEEKEDGTLGRERDHGQNTVLAKTVFVAANGRTVENDSKTGEEKILTGGATRDLPATILTALGFDAKHGDAQVIDGMFMPQAKLNKEDMPDLILSKVYDNKKEKVTSLEVMVDGIEKAGAYIEALDILIDTQSMKVDSIELMDGIELLHEDRSNGKVHLVLMANEAIVANEPMIKLNVLAEDSENVEITQAMFATAAKREVMPNLKVVDENQPGEVEVKSITVTSVNDVKEITTKGGTLQLTANVAPDNATKKEVKWTVSDTDLATISADGKLTAKANGTITVTATATDGSNVAGKLVIVISGQEQVSEDVKVTEVVISSANDVKEITTKDGTLQLTANVTPNNATKKEVKWTVSDTNRATISADGKLTAKSNGTVTVTATATDGSNVAGKLVIVISGQSTSSNGGGGAYPPYNPEVKPTPIEEDTDDKDGENETPTKPTDPELPMPEFSDLAGHWAQEAIMQAVQKGMIKGYTNLTIKPNAVVTREEFVVMLMRTLQVEKQVTTKATQFTDAKEISDWSKDAIAEAVQLGIVNGYTDGSFRPKAEISRAEMAKLIVQALQLSDVTVDHVTTPFADDKEIADWAKPYVAIAAQYELIKGKGQNQFVPNVAATRAEAIVMLLRM